MEQILGPLELRIMTVLWQIGRGTVRDVLDRLDRTPEPAYTTVMTVMSRLFQKGLLDRSPRGNSYVYEPIFTEQELFEETSRKAVRDVLSRFGDLAIAHFLEESQLSEEHIRQLRRLTQSEIEHDER